MELTKGLDADSSFSNVTGVDGPLTAINQAFSLPDWSKQVSSGLGRLPELCCQQPQAQIL